MWSKRRLSRRSDSSPPLGLETDASSAVRYGDTVRLVCKVLDGQNQVTGLVGYARKDTSDGRSEIVCAVRPCLEGVKDHSEAQLQLMNTDATESWRPSLFKVLDPRAGRAHGECVASGDEVVLLDEDGGGVWNNKLEARDHGMMTCKRRGSPGEMYVTFAHTNTLTPKPNKSTSEQHVLEYGLETTITCTNSNRTRARFNNVLHAMPLKRKGSRTKSDLHMPGEMFLTCLNKGPAVVFYIYRPPPTVESISVHISSACGGLQLNDTHSVPPSQLIRFKAPLNLLQAPNSNRSSNHTLFKAVMTLSDESEAVLEFHSSQVTCLDESCVEAVVDVQGSRQSGHIKVLVGRESPETPEVFPSSTTFTNAPKPASPTPNIRTPLLFGLVHTCVWLTLTLTLTLSFTISWKDVVMMYVATVFAYAMFHRTTQLAGQIPNPNSITDAAVSHDLVTYYMKPMWVPFSQQPSQDLVNDSNLIHGPKTLDRISSSASSNSLVDDGSTTSSASLHSDSVAAMDSIPPVTARFLAAENGNIEKATARWRETLEWRKANGADTCLLEPHTLFTAIKKFYPHYFHMRDKVGHVIYYELLGELDLQQLRGNGVTMQSLLWHYMYNMEFLWQHLQPDDNAQVTVVLDLKGVKLGDIAGDVLAFVKSCLGMTGQHYPHRSYKIFLLNVPGWFSFLWRMIKPFVHEYTRSKINVCDASTVLSSMETAIDVQNIPERYGGQCSIPFGQSEEELQLEAHVRKYLDAWKADERPSPCQSPSPAPSVEDDDDKAMTGAGLGMHRSTSNPHLRSMDHEKAKNMLERSPSIENDSRSDQVRIVRPKARRALPSWRPPTPV